MFCPKCRTEKREEFTICPVCNVPLIEELPPEPETEYISFITVFASGNQTQITIAKSILEDAGIQYFVKGEELQDLFGGRFGLGFNPVIGPAEIQVGEDDAEVARTLLTDLEEK